MALHPLPRGQEDGLDRAVPPALPLSHALLGILGEPPVSAGAIDGALRCLGELFRSAEGDDRLQSLIAWHLLQLLEAIAASQPAEVR